MAYNLKSRLTRLTKLAMANRPVKIVYNAESPCPGIEGNERTIEIRRIYPSEAGDIILRAFCRACDKEESFRLDRIVSHRALRKTAPPVDEAKPVTAYLTAQRGRIDPEDLSRPYVSKPTVDGLLAAARERIAEAAARRNEPGHHTGGPCTTKPINKADRCPSCPEPLPREVREMCAAAVAAEFEALTAPLAPTMPQEAHA